MAVPREDRLQAATRIGTVTLRVADLERATGFYEQVLGLKRLPGSAGPVGFSASGEAPALLALVEDVHAPARAARASGLFHFALLVPDRADLARALLHIRGRGWPFSGFADHAVSEAIYLSDPEENGIEIYADRPRSKWSWNSGEVVMTTEPLDVEDLVATVKHGEPQARLPRGTTVGHIHLEVSDLDAAEDFYGRRLGFETTLRSYPGARFMSAGGYHHHLAVNVWNRRRAPADPGARGLAGFEILVPDAEALAAASRRLATPVPTGSGFRTSDPFGIEVTVRTC